MSATTLAGTSKTATSAGLNPSGGNPVAVPYVVATMNVTADTEPKWAAMAEASTRENQPSLRRTA